MKTASSLQRGLGRLAILSRVLSVFFLLGAITTGAVTLFVLFGSVLSPAMLEGVGRTQLALAWSLPVRAVSVLSFGAMAWGCWSAHSCFRGLARGYLFSTDTVRGLRNFALGLLLHKGAFLLFLPLGGLYWLTHPEVRGAFNVTFDPITGDYTLLFAAGVAVIAEVMRRAAEIAEDNAQIV